MMDLLKLIKEGRVDEFKSKYGQKFTPDMVNKIVAEVTPKFLQWVGKVLDGINFDSNFLKITKALNIFEKISNNLPKTDINQYNTFPELIDAIIAYEKKPRRDIKKVEGGNVVYDDGIFFVVNPLNYVASCYYGRGTKWCTAAATDSQFKSYNEDGKLFYIIDRSKSTNDPLYKVALLRKFKGDTIYYDAKDDIIKDGWIFGDNILSKIENDITVYLKKEFAEQVKIYSDKEAAKKERERLSRLREEQRVQGLSDEAQDRKDENEWDLTTGDTPDEGLKAHALLNYLVADQEVRVLSNEDKADIQRITDEIERLNNEYDNDEEVRTELLDEISDLEDELDEYKNYIDVYNIVPTGTHYDTTEFEVINSPVSGNRYAVGDEDEMKSSCYDYLDNLIDDIGYEGFNGSFAKDYLDTDAIIRYAEDVYEQDINESPESYLSDEDKMLSDKQEEEINILNKRISDIEKTITHLEEQMDGNDDNDDKIQEKIDELKEVSEEYTDEIEEINDDPDGDYPQELIDDVIADRLRYVKRDPESFLEDYGLSWSEYVDKDDFIQGCIDADGYGHTINNYDGRADEIYVNNKLFYVMRID